jgi:hypothetical protein
MFVSPTYETTRRIDKVYKVDSRSMLVFDKKTQVVHGHAHCICRLSEWQLRDTDARSMSRGGREVWACLTNKVSLPIWSKHTTHAVFEVYLPRTKVAELTRRWRRRQRWCTVP